MSIFYILRYIMAPLILGILLGYLFSIKVISKNELRKKWKQEMIKKLENPKKEKEKKEYIENIICLLILFILSTSSIGLFILGLFIGSIFIFTVINCADLLKIFYFGSKINKLEKIKEIEIKED